MGKFLLVFFGLLVGYACIACAVAEKPTTSRARVATPSVTPSPTQEPTATVAPAATIPAGPTATPVASPTPQGPETIYEVYTVQRGDTLNRIAAHFSKDEGHSVTVEAIVTANGIKDPARIEVGEQFMIPVIVGDYVPTPVRNPNVTVMAKPTSVPSLGVTCAQVYQPLLASSVRWVPKGKLNRHTADWHSTMTPNGSITVDLYGPCTGLEAVEVWFIRTAPLDQVLITRDILVAAAMPGHAAEVGAWFDDALDRMAETGDLIQRERLSQIYLTTAYSEKSKRFVYIMDVLPQ